MKTDNKLDLYEAIETLYFLLAQPLFLYIYITISTFTSVRPYGGVVRPVPSRPVPLPSFKFLQVYEKVSLIKVAWYV